MVDGTKRTSRRRVLRGLGVAGVASVGGLSGCLGSSEGDGADWSHTVIWDGEPLAFDDVRCRTGFNSHTILAETDDSEFKVSYHTHDEHVDVIALRLDSGDTLFRSRFHDPPENVEWEWEDLGDNEYDAETAGTVTLTPNTDPAEDAHPDGADVEFDLSC